MEINLEDTFLKLWMAVWVMNGMLFTAWIMKLLIQAIF